MPNSKPINAKPVESIDTKNLFKTKNSKIIALIVGALIVALLIFVGGMNAGFHKAKFSCNWGKNYERNFMGQSQRGSMGFFRDFEGRELRNAHGLAGSIISITDTNLAIKDRDGKENTVAVSGRTIIKKHREDIKISDLKQSDQIVVVGKPGDDGVINADIIRVFEKFPSPSSNDNSGLN
jgi:hypothetical protein